VRDMLSNVIPPDACLVAVALVIRSRDGPRFVFHYPPRPDTKVRRRKPLYGTELDLSGDDDSSDDAFPDDDDDLEDIGFKLHQDLEKLDLGKSKSRRLDPWDGDHHYSTPDGQLVVPWEHLFEFETRDLESILTPARPYHKKRFQLTLDPLTYLAYPIHIREDGQWRKKRREKKQKRLMTDSMTSDRTLHGETLDRGMTMFNVVFITNPDRREKDTRNLDIYDHVARKINKALKYAQAQDDYVWKESEMILGMKERAREDRLPMSSLWNQILDNSTLARALQEIYLTQGSWSNLFKASPYHRQK